MVLPLQTNPFPFPCLPHPPKNNKRRSFSLCGKMIDQSYQPLLCCAPKTLWSLRFATALFAWFIFHDRCRIPPPVHFGVSHRAGTRGWGIKKENHYYFKQPKCQVIRKNSTWPHSTRPSQDRGHTQNLTGLGGSAGWEKSGAPVLCQGTYTWICFFPDLQLASERCSLGFKAVTFSIRKQSACKS